MVILQTLRRFTELALVFDLIVKNEIDENHQRIFRDHEILVGKAYVKLLLYSRQ
jgi:hypothetical protein